MGEEDGSCTPPAKSLRQAPPKTPMAARLQSPPFPLGSNDDERERAQARAAARAAAVRRKSVALNPPVSFESKSNILDRSQIMDLFHNCIKLASENKINQKNTWELSLIDHLSEIVRVSPGDDDETNFQKASCTLEAGVKIYSMRVDSVHSEAYKVLGGINRAGREEDNATDNIEVGDNIDTAQTDGLSKKELEKKMSPLSTLESSFEVLNVKKFDVAFIVDPLYHQTSAQFDEGGAKGLLLNNLGVYGGCRVLFDSFECPESSMPSEFETQEQELIDLSFAKDCIEKMMICVPAANDISPTLRDILNLFDEDNRRPPDIIFSEAPIAEGHLEEDNHIETGENAFDDDCGAWNLDQDDQSSVVDDNSATTNLNFTSHLDEDFDCKFDGPYVEEKYENIADFLSQGLGFTSKSNAWAGPDHWKYRKVKAVEQTQLLDTNSETVNKKLKNRKEVRDIDFTKSLENNIPDIFAPPKNPKSLLLPVNKTTGIISLPEDCHYQPDNLVKLFLLPHMMCLGKNGRKFCDEAIENDENGAPMASWDAESITYDHIDDGTVCSDAEEDQGTLVHQPRQVNKVDIQYDKVSKQVDVHALKNLLWNHVQESVQISSEKPGCEATVTLRQVLQHFQNDCTAGSAKDVSPHLIFICLLHLANEHGLSIHDRPSLDELDINIPSSALVS